MQSFEKFADLKLINVFRRVDPDVASRVISLWERNSILPKGVDETERVKQVAVAALSATGDVVGVNTVYVDALHVKGDVAPLNAFHYRMYIEPRSRRPQLMRVMTSLAMRIIEAEAKVDDPDRFVLIAENPGVARPGMRALLMRIGLQHVGVTQHNQSIFEKKFR